jgi:hypothetical protein
VQNDAFERIARFVPAIPARREAKMAAGMKESPGRAGALRSLWKNHPKGNLGQPDDNQNRASSNSKRCWL